MELSVVPDSELKGAQYTSVYNFIELRKAMQRKEKYVEFSIHNRPREEDFVSAIDEIALNTNLQKFELIVSAQTEFTRVCVDRIIMRLNALPHFRWLELIGAPLDITVPWTRDMYHLRCASLQTATRFMQQTTTLQSLNLDFSITNDADFFHALRRQTNLQILQFNRFEQDCGPALKACIDSFVALSELVCDDPARVLFGPLLDDVVGRLTSLRLWTLESIPPSVWQRLRNSQRMQRLEVDVEHVPPQDFNTMIECLLSLTNLHTLRILKSMGNDFFATKFRDFVAATRVRELEWSLSCSYEDAGPDEIAQIQTVLNSVASNAHIKKFTFDRGYNESRDDVHQFTYREFFRNTTLKHIYVSDNISVDDFIGFLGMPLTNLEVETYRLQVTPEFVEALRVTNIPQIRVWNTEYLLNGTSEQQMELSTTFTDVIANHPRGHTFIFSGARAQLARERAAKRRRNEQDAFLTFAYPKRFLPPSMQGYAGESAGLVENEIRKFLFG